MLNNKNKFFKLSGAAILILGAGYFSLSKSGSYSPTSVSYLKTSHEYNESILKDRLSDDFGINAFMVKEIHDTGLFVVFSDNGTFITNSSMNVALKGKAIDPKSGEDFIQNIANENKDELIASVNRHQNISAFFRTPQKQIEDTKVIGTNTVDIKEPAVEVTTRPRLQKLPSQGELDNILKKQIEVGQINNQSALLENQSQGTKEPTQRIASPAFPIQPEQVRVAPQVPLTPQALESRGRQVNKSDGTNDLLKMMMRMNVEDRKVEGPKIAAVVLPKLPDQYFAVYEADPAVPYKGTVTVATDTTCPHCREFHALIPTLQSEGVKVRLMPYPRRRLIDYNFPPGFTIDEYVRRTKSEPLNEGAQKTIRAYCTTNRPESYDLAFFGKATNAQVIPDDNCIDQIREFKVMGDLFFTNRTPYIIWGDANTKQSENGFIEGVNRTDSNIGDLLLRLQKSA